MTFRLIQWFLRLITRVVANVELRNLDRIPAQGGCIIASNHLGRLEVILVYSMLPRNDLIMIAAEKYAKYGFFRWLARQVDAVFVDRFNADLRTVREVLKRLKQGMVFVVAPEGTRSKTEALQPGRPGAAYIAAKAGVPVVPVGVIGTEDRVVKNNLKRLRRSKVVVQVGEPFSLPPLPSENRDGALATYTDEIMCRIAALIPEKYRGVYASHPRLQQILSGV
jgi:1-acyl-sn-glycerol-3-phosphate acyltransferase